MKARIVTLMMWLLASAPVAAVANSPFCDLQVDGETAAVRDAFLAGDFPKMAELLKRADAQDPANQALDLGLQVVQLELADPLSLLLHTHDFAGGELGAFVPNGQPDPTEIIGRLARQIAETSPEAACHIADALCLAVALQLKQAILADGPIAVADDILFTQRVTSAKRELGKTLALEVLCSHDEARKQFHSLVRGMFLQQLRRENAPFFIGGLWIPVKNLASELDPESRNRWQDVYLELAEQCSAKNRFASGALIRIYGAHVGTDGAWKSLLENSEKLGEQPDPRAILNLKIAFAYLGEAIHTRTNSLPQKDDETFAALKKNLEGLGDRSATKIAFEAAGLK